jgi:hypothetical protein
MVAGLVILLSAGCAGVGPGTMARDRFDYTAPIVTIPAG